MKKCSKCKEEKNEAEFGKNRSMKDGLAHYCKQCMRESQRKYRQSEKGKAYMRDYQREYRQSEKGKAVRRKWRRTEKGRAYLRKYQRSEYRKAPEKIKARSAVNSAVRLGKLDKPTCCSMCGEEKDRIEGHHYRGYEEEFWLDVQWLCVSCHIAEEKANTLQSMKKKNRGALFNNDRRETPNQPRYKGRLDVDGKLYWVSGWVNTNNKDGSKYLSVSVQEADEEYQSKHRQELIETGELEAENHGAPARHDPDNQPPTTTHNVHDLHKEEDDSEIPF